MSDTVRMLPEENKEDYVILRAKHKELLAVEAQKREHLLKVVEPRNKWIDSCLVDCAKNFKDSKLAMERVSGQTKEVMMKAKFKEYDMAEFQKNFVFGL